MAKKKIDKYANDNANKMIVGTKTDLISKREVTFDDAKLFADSLGITYIETSSQGDQADVDRVFLTIAAEVKVRCKPNPPPKRILLEPSARRHTHNDGIAIDLLMITGAVVFSPVLLIGYGGYCAYSYVTDENRRLEREAREEDRRRQSQANEKQNSAKLIVGAPTLHVTETQRAKDRHTVVALWDGQNFSFGGPVHYVFQVQMKSTLSYWSAWENLGITHTNTFALTKIEPQSSFAVRVRASYSFGVTVDAKNTHNWSPWSEPGILTNSNPREAADGTVMEAASGTQQGQVGGSHGYEKRDYWVSNTVKCQLCRVTFSLNLRQHHCRECGKCVCVHCSPASQVAYVAAYGKLVRICKRCNNQRTLVVMIKNTRVLETEPDFASGGLEYLRLTHPAICVESTESVKFWAEGATAIVYKASYNSIPVAVKQYKHSFVTFRDEHKADQSSSGKKKHSRALSRDSITMESEFYVACVKCPFALQMKFADVSDNTAHPFVATELIAEHGTLMMVLNNRSVHLTWRWKIKVLLQVAYFLRFIHERNLVHVDLKAENCVVVSVNDTNDVKASPLVKVFDFNSSSYVGDVTYDQIFMMSRTPSHSPPEFIQANNHAKMSNRNRSYSRSSGGNLTSLSNNNNGHDAQQQSPAVQQSVLKLDEKYDIFSFGILMAEVASRGLYYPDESAVSDAVKIETAVVEGERPMLTADLQESEHLPPDFKNLAELCWSENPASRPSASFLTCSLESMLHKIETGLLPSTPSVKISDYGTSAKAMCDDNIIAHKHPHELPQFILVLKPDAFKIRKVLNSRKLGHQLYNCTEAEAIEKSTFGMKVFSVEDLSVHERYTCASVSGQFEPLTVYKKHPTEPKYILASAYLSKMFVAKVNEFANILQALGAKTISITHYEVKDKGVAAHAGETSDR